MRCMKVYWRTACRRAAAVARRRYAPALNAGGLQEVVSDSGRACEVPV